MSPRMGLDLPAILQAATEIADQQGLENVSLAGLANKLDVRSPSLYNHVNGLPGLRKKMAVYGIGLLTADMRHAAVGRSGDEALRAIARAYVSFVRKHPGLYEATLRARRLTMRTTAANRRRLSPWSSVCLTCTNIRGRTFITSSAAFAACCTALPPWSSRAASGCRLAWTIRSSC